jgi:flagellar hook-length control protein FliK
MPRGSPLSGQERAALLAKVVAEKTPWLPLSPGLTHRKRHRWPIPGVGRTGATASRATSAYGDGVIRTVAQGPALQPHRSPPARDGGRAEGRPVAGEARQAEAASGQEPVQGPSLR